MATLEKSATASAGTKVISDLRAFARLAVVERDKGVCLEIARTPGLAIIPVQLREGDQPRTLGSLILDNPMPEVAIAVLKSDVAMLFDGTVTFGGLAVKNSREAADYVKRYGLTEEIELEKATVQLANVTAWLGKSGVPPWTLMDVAMNPRLFNAYVESGAEGLMRTVG